MKIWTIALVGVIAMALVASDALAQGPRRGQGEPRQGQQGPGQGFRPPPPPIMAALDANKDGTLSAEEIENAVKALKTLDKNKDGKLTPEELRPEFGGQGGFGRGGGGGFGGGAGRGAGGGGVDAFVERIMGMDANEDGKVSKDELPPMMQRMLQFGDANNDGAIDKKEAQQMGQRMMQGRGGMQRGGPGGDRPQRPQRPGR